MDQIPEDMLKDWIVEDMQTIFSKFDENRYSIFEDFEKLDQMADSIKSIKNWYKENQS